MSKAKWYNPTHDQDWDEYYTVFFIVWGSVFAFIMLILAVGLLS